MPLPEEDGCRVRAAELRILAGVPESEWANVAVGSVLGLICLLQARASLIAASVYLQLGDRLGEHFTTMLMVGACALTAISTIVLCIFWFRRLRVPDHLPLEFDPNALGRRRAILITLGIPLFALIVANFSLQYPNLLLRLLHNPRYRQRRKEPLAEVSLANGFYLNKRS
jgi:hypothetical protein